MEGESADLFVGFVKRLEDLRAPKMKEREEGLGMKKRNCITAAVLAVLFALTILTSSVFIISHADHDCTGEDCPICEQVYACAQSLKNLVAAVAAMMVMLAFRFAAQAVMEQAKYAYIPHTPVNLKVKLSN